MIGGGDAGGGTYPTCDPEPSTEGSHELLSLQSVSRSVYGMKAVCLVLIVLFIMEFNAVYSFMVIICLFFIIPLFSLYSKGGS